MKKYPVIYKEKEYEVRWETVFYQNYLSIYEVRKTFGIKYFKEICNEHESVVKEILKDVCEISKDDPNYYIEEVKCLFKLMELEIEKQKKKETNENTQKKALADWDGVIDE